MTWNIVFVSAIVLLTFFFVTGTWATDIGASVMISSAAGVPLIASGIFGERSGNIQYHLGLMLSSLSFLILAVLFIFHLHRDEKTPKKGI